MTVKVLKAALNIIQTNKQSNGINGNERNVGQILLLGKRGLRYMFIIRVVSVCVRNTVKSIAVHVQLSRG